MPPNGQDSHAAVRNTMLRAAATSPAAAAAAASKMDSFMSSTCSPLTLQFVDITYRVKIDPSTAPSAFSGRLRRRIFAAAAAAVPEERTILKGVTGEARPGEVLAVLGPSGSGKSTLLSILAGRLPGSHHSGAILAAAGDHTLPRSSLRRAAAFVSQDDVLLPHLTVRETLLFCAALRLPASSSSPSSAAAAVISELSLSACADTIVGNAFVRGVSGGERKRVSIGHELLLNPSLLILDEPTSGLDSTAAARLVTTLSGLARKGRTVILSVHQPSSRVYRMFDKVLLLSEGGCLYFGPGRDAMDYFRSVGFAPGFQVNPADFMLDLANGFAQAEYNGAAEESDVKHSLVCSYDTILAPKVKACISAALLGDHAQIGNGRCNGIAEGGGGGGGGATWLNQFSILLRRSLKERRHETFNSLRVFQVMSAAALAGAMWWRSRALDVQDRLGLLFFVSIFWGVFASFNAVFAFPQERPVLVKERASGMYALSSYFMSRMAGDLPMELILPTVFTVMLYWMAGLNPEPLAFLLTLAVLLGYVLVAQGLGLAVGAIVMDAKRASTLVTVIMLAFLLTGGFYVQNAPHCMRWVKYTSFTYYCYRLLIGIQYSGHLKVLLGQTLEGEASALVCVTALVAMFFGYRILAYVALRRIKT